MSIFRELLVRVTNLNEQGRQDLRIGLVLAAVAMVLYAFGIGWGLPQADGPGKTRPWGPDEIGPIGPIVEVANSLSHGYLGNPQYPLFHYIFVDCFYFPYLFLKLLTGGLAHPHAGYPFGFKDPASGVCTLLLIARSVSVLMGAGTVMVAYFTAKTLWNRGAGIIAGVFVMLMYPMFYYARMSNVDVPAMFWTSLVLLLFARGLKDGLPAQRGLWMGLFAALAVATKDQSYGILLFLPLAILPVHFRVLGAQGRTDMWSRWQAPLAALVVSAAGYCVASGFALRPSKFLWHLSYIRAGAPHYRFYFKYPATMVGYWALCRENLQYLINTLGWPIFLAAVIGILVSLVRERSTLAFLLPFPSLFLTVFAPVRYTELRYVIVWGFILACFAGYAVAWGLQSARRPIQILAVLLLASGCGWALLRGMDLTYALLYDSRYTAAEWFARHAHDGDRVQYFARFPVLDSLPRLRPGPVWSNFAATPLPSKDIPNAEFVFTMGPEDQVLHWNCPAWIYERLKNGSLGYQLAATIQTPTLLSHPILRWVNPRIEIFVRRDLMQQTGR